jgi:PBP1b-binding outer membrane lipoprotein LpoB
MQSCNSQNKQQNTGSSNHGKGLDQGGRNAASKQLSKQTNKQTKNRNGCAEQGTTP